MFTIFNPHETADAVEYSLNLVTISPVTDILSYQYEEDDDDEWTTYTALLRSISPKKEDHCRCFLLTHQDFTPRWCIRCIGMLGCNITYSVIILFDYWHENKNRSRTVQEFRRKKKNKRRDYSDHYSVEWIRLNGRQRRRRQFRLSLRACVRSYWCCCCIFSISVSHPILGGMDWIMGSVVVDVAVAVPIPVLKKTPSTKKTRPFCSSPLFDRAMVVVVVVHVLYVRWSCCFLLIKMLDLSTSQPSQETRSSCAYCCCWWCCRGIDNKGSTNPITVYYTACGLIGHSHSITRDRPAALGDNDFERVVAIVVVVVAIVVIVVVDWTLRLSDTNW